MKLGFYYSQAQDWNHPGGASRHGRRDWDDAQNGSMDEYIRKIAVPAGARDPRRTTARSTILWWDTPM